MSGVMQQSSLLSTVDSTQNTTDTINYDSTIQTPQHHQQQQTGDLTYLATPLSTYEHSDNNNNGDHTNDHDHDHDHDNNNDHGDDGADDDQVFEFRRSETFRFGPRLERAASAIIVDEDDDLPSESLTSGATASGQSLSSEDELSYLSEDIDTVEYSVSGETSLSDSDQTIELRIFVPRPSMFARTRGRSRAHPKKRKNRVKDKVLSFKDRMSGLASRFRRKKKNTDTMDDNGDNADADDDDDHGQDDGSNAGTTDGNSESVGDTKNASVDEQKSKAQAEATRWNQTKQSQFRWAYSVPLTEELVTILDLKQRLNEIERAKYPDADEKKAQMYSSVFMQGWVKVHGSSVLLGDNILLEALTPEDSLTTFMTLDLIPYPFTESMHTPSLRGYLRKKGAVVGIWNRRHFVLHKRNLTYGRIERKHAAHSKVIPLSSFDIMVPTSASADSLEFHIIGKDHTTALRAPTPHEYRQWVDDLSLLSRIEKLTRKRRRKVARKEYRLQQHGPLPFGDLPGDSNDVDTDANLAPACTAAAGTRACMKSCAECHSRFRLLQHRYVCTDCGLVFCSSHFVKSSRRCTAHHKSFSMAACKLAHSGMDALKSINLDYNLLDMLGTRADDATADSCNSRVESFVGLLRINVLQAYNVLDADTGGSSDPYAVIIFEEHLYRTQTIPETLYPVWRESFAMKSRGQSPLLFVGVFDEDELTKDDFLGMVCINLAKLPRNELVDGWFPLQPRPGSFARSDHDVRGEIHLQIRYSYDLMVLFRPVCTQFQIKSMAQKMLRRNHKLANRKRLHEWLVSWNSSNRPTSRRRDRQRRFTKEAQADEVRTQYILEQLEDAARHSGYLDVSEPMLLGGWVSASATLARSSDMSIIHGKDMDRQSQRHNDKAVAADDDDDSVGSDEELVMLLAADAEPDELHITDVERDVALNGPKYSRSRFARNITRVKDAYNLVAPSAFLKWLDRVFHWESPAESMLVYLCFLYMCAYFPPITLIAWIPALLVITMASNWLSEHGASRNKTRDTANLGFQLPPTKRPPPGKSDTDTPNVKSCSLRNRASSRDDTRSWSRQSTELGSDDKTQEVHHHTAWEADISDGDPPTEDRSSSDEDVGFLQGLRNAWSSVKATIRNIQNKLEDVAIALERLYMLLHWKDHQQSTIAFIALTVLFFVLLFVPFRLLIALVGTNKFTKHLRKLAKFRSRGYTGPMLYRRARRNSGNLALNFVKRIPTLDCETATEANLPPEFKV
jgi:C2 domain/PH domain/Integral peroxisomal membrane peroxin